MTGHDNVYGCPFPRPVPSIGDYWTCSDCGRVWEAAFAGWALVESFWADVRPQDLPIRNVEPTMTPADQYHAANARQLQAVRAQELHSTLQSRPFSTPDPELDALRQRSEDVAEQEALICLHEAHVEILRALRAVQQEGYTMAQAIVGLGVLATSVLERMVELQESLGHLPRPRTVPPLQQVADFLGAEVEAVMPWLRS